MNPLRPSRRLAALSFAALAAASMSTVTAQDAASQEHPAVKAVARIRAEVARMRGLQYQADVKVGVKSPAEIRTMVLGDFEKEAPAEDMAKQEKVYKQLGLIPPEYDLRARMIDFLSEQIGGYYDPEKKELFLVDQTQGGAAQVPGAQEAMDEMVMAHELHHALQDQNYDLSRWMELLSSHDDRIQGYKSLVEGEAQLVGMTYLFKKMGRGDVDIAAFNRMQDMAMRFSPEAQKMRDVPPYLLENMMFPYTQGAEFVQAMQRKLGWERIGQAFNDPPMSTEQVLHPEKFLGAERDEPTELMLPGFEAVLGKDAEELHENTLGEFNVTLLLRARGASKAVAAKAAAGWAATTRSGASRSSRSATRAPRRSSSPGRASTAAARSTAPCRASPPPATARPRARGPGSTRPTGSARASVRTATPPRRSPSSSASSRRAPTTGWRRPRSSAWARPRSTPGGTPTP